MIYTNALFNNNNNIVFNDNYIEPEKPPLNYIESLSQEQPREQQPQNER